MSLKSVSAISVDQQGERRETADSLKTAKPTKSTATTKSAKNKDDQLMVITLDNFRDIQGELGTYYITEAIFNVMIRLRDELNTNSGNRDILGADASVFATLEDYLVYHDV